MLVKFGHLFTKHFVNYPKQDQMKIRAFIKHIEDYGFTGLTGRNKSSDNVPFDDPQWGQKVDYAKTHKLWHYHIGIPNYQQTDIGEQVSEYILHYIRQEDYIVLVSLSAHPPFELPNPDYLTY